MQLSVRRRACTLVTVLTSADERGHWCVRAIVHLSFPINPLHTYSYTVLLLFQPNGSEATLRFWLHLHLNAHGMNMHIGRRRHTLLLWHY